MRWGKRARNSEKQDGRRRRLSEGWKRSIEKEFEEEKKAFLTLRRRLTKTNVVEVEEGEGALKVASTGWCGQKRGYGTPWTAKEAVAAGLKVVPFVPFVAFLFTSPFKTFLISLCSPPGAKLPSFNQVRRSSSSTALKSSPTTSSAISAASPTFFTPLIYDALAESAGERGTYQQISTGTHCSYSEVRRTFLPPLDVEPMS